MYWLHIWHQNLVGGKGLIVLTAKFPDLVVALIQTLRDTYFILVHPATKHFSTVSGVTLICFCLCAVSSSA